jgi:hypothetical protein
MSDWGSEVEKERKRRISISLYAYAYEYENDSLVDDATFDELSRQINPNMKTGHDVLDKFFAEEFEPDTGMWIRKHPDLHGVKFLYEAYRTGQWLKYTLKKISKPLDNSR